MKVSCKLQDHLDSLIGLDSSRYKPSDLYRERKLIGEGHSAYENRLTAISQREVQAGKQET